MTRDGVAYELPTSVPRTEGSGSSSSPGLLPTPDAKLSDSGPVYARAKRNGSGGDDLTTTVHRHLLPPPRATDRTKGGPNPRRSSGDIRLPSAVQLLPTPTAMDSKASGGSGASDVTLTDAMVRGKLLPTPMTSYSARTADEWRAGRPAGNGQVREAIGDLRIIAEELLS